MKRLLPALLMTLVLSACGGDSDVASAPAADSAPATKAPTPTVAPTATPRAGPVADGSRAASCVETYDATTIAERAFAFDGTVVAVRPGRTSKPGAGSLDTAAVTFFVNEWFKGGTESTVTVEMMSPDGIASHGTPPGYEKGTRLLVSGEPRWGGKPLDDPIAWTCGGFTRYYEPAVADQWRPGTG